MKKRGISPLIATVLLIGFVVIIAASVYLWYGDIVKGEILKRGAMADIEADCASVIDIDVSDADFLSSTDEVSVTVRNVGAELFHGLRVIVDYPDGNVVLSEKEMFKPGDEKELTLNCIDCSSMAGTPNQIEVMPVIVRQGVPGTCSNKKIVYNLT